MPAFPGQPHILDSRHPAAILAGCAPGALYVEGIVAKNLLSFFGGSSILSGFLIILGGLWTENGIALSISLYAGGGFLLAGAPLLGFARVIVLLEGIERNTKFLVPPPPGPPERLTLDQMLERARNGSAR